MSLSSDFQKLFVDGLVTLYELDARKLGGDIYRWHGHIAFEEWERIYLLAGSQEMAGSTLNAGKAYESGNKKMWQQNIIWLGKTFEPMALDSSGFEMRTDGKASAPSLTLANNINGIQGAVSAYCLQLQDFVGAKLKVIRTTAKYLDAENFGAGNPHAANDSSTQNWYIEQKTSENAQQVTFELSNPIDFQGQRIPAVQISSMCRHAVGDYRGEQCGYIGTAMFTDKNEPTDNPAFDRCGGYLKSCRVRKNESRFGGQPASNMVA